MPLPSILSSQYEPDCLNLNPPSITPTLRDFGQVSYLCASVFSTENGHKRDTYIIELEVVIKI